ncbi:hypothetical protein CIG75_06435 [Tumebacillus algifaecis]|uniref:Uncharacterized protein n=2 Tax=Tumebacillus algifaecis TaxID=1214604 RepID=A0A223CZS3_9BACL|nr:hypothetical protein CIG75_06435 [Tumebacillus algifaecis]
MEQQEQAQSEMNQKLIKLVDHLGASAQQVASSAKQLSDGAEHQVQSIEEKRDTSTLQASSYS